jgi:hypothetical protein
VLLTWNPNDAGDTVIIVAAWKIKKSGFDPGNIKKKSFLIYARSRPALGLNQVPIQRVTGAFSTGGKMPLNALLLLLR